MKCCPVAWHVVFRFSGCSTCCLVIRRWQPLRTRCHLAACTPAAAAGPDQLHVLLCIRPVVIAHGSQCLEAAALLTLSVACECQLISLLLGCAHMRCRCEGRLSVSLDLSLNNPAGGSHLSPPCPSLSWLGVPQPPQAHSWFRFSAAHACCCCCVRHIRRSVSESGIQQQQLLLGYMQQHCWPLQFS